MDKQKKHIDNNLYIYYGKKSYRVKIYSLHLSKITRFQARHVKATSSILEATLATQLEN